ncbi:hypothetical protein BKA67DRAFT_577166 [Truncatella angustata]|uniref:Uncharacterized protein n=1 Tax=Truncatella angustata TaxID=152316 RepID=A0A9P8UAI8_9PEZI|nr:uncharacterized protein BKA67DRAFT_577166 [Truncatella angustata]KAH6647331.1 hypothetical protein BKA67DRAFT_577166 [Truncatella angustata]KAH8203185.1 hypothetical protein TruAng_002706 [Truncatella angustata]
MSLVSILPVEYPGLPPQENPVLEVREMNEEACESSLGHPNPLGLHPVNKQRTSTRRISAGFSTDGPPSCLPSVATSSLTASTTRGELPTTYAAAPRLSMRKTTPTSIPLPKASTATTYEMAAEYHAHNQENIPPHSSLIGLQHKHKNSIEIAAAKLGTKSKPRTVGALPKSNTLNVISNLTASVSRSSLSKFSRSTSISSTFDSEPRSSICNASGTSLGVSGIDSGNPRQIHTAQSSAYWTGRFVALEDRFHNEMLLPGNMTTLVTAHAERSIVPDYRASVPAHMPASASNPNLMRNIITGQSSRYSTCTATKSRLRAGGGSVDAGRLENEENRARRVFLHLEALCATSEARKSLHAWQQKYARRKGKEQLLPRGGSMEDRGWVGRLLGRGSHNGRRGSFVGVALG